MKKHVGLFLLALVMSASSFAPQISTVQFPLAGEFTDAGLSANGKTTALSIASIEDAPIHGQRNQIAGELVKPADTIGSGSNNILVVEPDGQQQATTTPTPTRTPIPPTATPTKTNTPIPPTATPTPARALVFSDEFNSSTWDRTRWLPCHWWATTYCTSQPMNELELYTAQNVLADNGKLILRGSKLSTPIQYCDKDCRNYSYASGMVQAGGGRWPDRPAGFTFTYGYVEVRAKIPPGKGLWTGIWLWPANYKDPPEIDIMEATGDVPNKIQMTYHRADNAEFQRIWSGPDFSQDYHTFAIDWLPNALVWYVDGAERYRWTGTTPNQAMYPILNLAIGGNGPGTPDASTVFPADFAIDYIRIYKDSLAP